MRRAARLKFPVARTIEVRLTADGATRALADKILRFRPRGNATPGPVGPRQADRACAVISGPCDIDSILVAVLRDRVVRGEYRVDARTVARKMIAAHGL